MFNSFVSKNLWRRNKVMSLRYYSMFTNFQRRCLRLISRTYSALQDFHDLHTNGHNPYFNPIRRYTFDVTKTTPRYTSKLSTDSRLFLRSSNHRVNMLCLQLLQLIKHLFIQKY